MGAKKENLLLRVNKVIGENIMFCNSNYLKINNNKTALMRTTTREQHQVNPSETVIFNTVDDNGEWV